MQTHNADNKHDRKRHNHDRVDLKPRRLVRVELFTVLVQQLPYHVRRASVLVNILNIVLVLPPAPAALVLAGLAFATLSCLSAAALRLIMVLGPPGGVGDVGLALLEDAPGALTGEVGRSAWVEGIVSIGRIVQEFASSYFLNHAVLLL